MSAAAQEQTTGAASTRRFRIRTITAGTTVATLADTAAVERAADALLRCRARFQQAGYEIQTLRVALNPIVPTLDAAARGRQLDAIAALDRLVAAKGALLNIGPVLVDDRPDPDLAGWCADLVQATTQVNFSVTVASMAGGVHRHAARESAAIIARLARLGGDGSANFRFAAAAQIPPGTPFFPVGWHQGDDSLALGLESANLVFDAFQGAGDPSAGEGRLRAVLERELTPLVPLGDACARDERRRFLGIDPSPAPGLDCSIGKAIEALTGTPFGEAGTLDACSTVTAVLKSIGIPTCGYAGLMLPVLEDQGLAARAGERRYDIKDLLLFSSVCGTGLDVVPVPGDVSPIALERLITDVAALSVRLRKPLSARLFPAPGRKAGEVVSFDNPYLTPSVVFALS